jgi:nitrogenase molybdenum-iron protein alpha/beta subunit
MSDYNYDAAMDQLAEWEEEAMEAYYAQEFESYQDTIYTDELDESSSSSEMVHLPSEPIQAWTDPETPVENKIKISPQNPPFISSDTETILLQKIEKDAEQKITQILQQKQPIDADTCVHIMKQGVEEFKKKTGRDMSYSEMRNAFG